MNIITIDTINQFKIIYMQKLIIFLDLLGGGNKVTLLVQ
jgi:hypothetical protein